MRARNLTNCEKKPKKIQDMKGISIQFSSAVQHV